MIESEKPVRTHFLLTEIKPAPENSLLYDGFTPNVSTRPCRKSIPAKLTSDFCKIGWEDAGLLSQTKSPWTRTRRWCEKPPARDKGGNR